MLFANSIRGTKSAMNAGFCAPFGSYAETAQELRLIHNFLQQSIRRMRTMAVFWFRHLTIECGAKGRHTAQQLEPIVETP